jgi:hypothetical protein
MQDAQIITATVVPGPSRLAFVDNLIGLSWVLIFEPTLYGMAENLSSEYNGGYWEFVSLSNGGAFFYPIGDTQYAVSSDNGFQGDLSAEAFGITATLYSLSHVSFSGGKLAETCAETYYKLREFACQHAEARSILAAID